MNLIGDPWVPVLDGDGQGRTVGLQELYERCHLIRDLSVQPLQRIALTRLLMCITQAALAGPQDEGDWRACRNRIQPESLRYLAERCDRFELYGARPFLQVTALDPKRNFRVDKMDFGLAGGINPTLFDHGAAGPPRVHADAWRALQLPVVQLFSQSSPIKTTSWNGVVTRPNTGHSPAAVESALHALVRGGSLLNTIWLNLINRTDVDCAWGLPVWDVDAPHPESAAAKDLAASHLGRLVPMSRGILLESGRADFTLVDGWTYGKPPAGREPSATVVVNPRGSRAELSYLGTDPDRHPWRDAPSVLALDRSAGPGGPRTLLHLTRHRDLGTVDIWLGGIVLDNAAKVRDTAEWVLAVPVDLVGEAPLQTYTAGVAQAESGANRLRAAVGVYAGSLKLARKQRGGLRQAAARAYWSRLDHASLELIQASVSASPDLAGWRGTVRTAGQEAYAAACAHSTPRQIQAFAAGRRALFGRPQLAMEVQTDE